MINIANQYKNETIPSVKKLLNKKNEEFKQSASDYNKQQLNATKTMDRDTKFMENQTRHYYDYDFWRDPKVSSNKNKGQTFKYVEPSYDFEDSVEIATYGKGFAIYKDFDNTYGEDEKIYKDLNKQKKKPKSKGKSKIKNKPI